MSSKYGRKPRFDLPWRNYRTIYAVLFTNGIVKVGCTSSMHTRFVALASEARRLHRCDLASIHYGQNIPGARAYRSAEKELLCRMHRIAKPCRKKIEYF